MAGENAILTLITDIREGMKEVKVDVKELRNETHELNIRFAGMGDTNLKIDAVNTKVTNLNTVVVDIEVRLREAEKKLAITENQSLGFPELQKDHWQKTGKAAGIGVAFLSFIAIAGLLVKLLS